jgi:WD40 repeat protein
METLVLLIGTSGGGVLELNLTNINSSDKFRYQFKVYFESHCISQNKMRKQLISTHPDLQILASVGDDSTLKIWDFESHRLISTKQLDTECFPSACKFSKLGILAVGMNNGHLLLLSCKHAAWGIGLKNSPEIGIVFTSRESNSAILAVEFSNNEEFMAVSFDNYRGEHLRFRNVTGSSKTGSGGEILHGFVMLYQQIEGPDSISFRKLQRIQLPFSHIRDIASYPSRSECAVTEMEFSKEGAYLGMIHSKVRYKDHLPSNL